MPPNNGMHPRLKAGVRPRMEISEFGDKPCSCQRWGSSSP